MKYIANMRDGELMIHAGNGSKWARRELQRRRDNRIALAREEKRAAYMYEFEAMRRGGRYLAPIPSR